MRDVVAAAIPAELRDGCRAAEQEPGSTESLQCFASTDGHEQFVFRAAFPHEFTTEPVVQMIYAGGRQDKC